MMSYRGEPVAEIEENSDKRHATTSVYRVLYDGQCEICQSCVSWLKALDHEKKPRARCFCGIFSPSHHRIPAISALFQTEPRAPQPAISDPVQTEHRAPRMACRRLYTKDRTHTCHCLSTPKDS